jgi:hypothetical protein
MGLLSHKDPAAKDQPRHQPHAYKEPKDSSSGRIACQICGQPPQDAVHPADKNAADSGISWS